jgi:hypothetical protein
MTELAIRILREVREAINTSYPDDRVPAVSLVIDYPRENETVRSSSYGIRIGAGPALKDIEVSINGDSWHRCRPCQGFWWYDWHGYLPGPKFVIARATSRRGEKIITNRRRFTAG